MTDTITTELRGKMGTLGWYGKDGNIVYTTGGEPASEMACLVINSKTFADLCDAIDAVHASLEAKLAEWGERGVLLPLDADGVPVRLDDLMEWPDHTDDPFEVIGIGNGTLYYVEGGVIQWTRAETKRHYAPDTWERIIEDAIMGGDEDALVARCKALAGDAE